MDGFPKLTLRHLRRYRVPLDRPVLDGGVIEMPAGDFIQVANAENARFVAHLEFRGGVPASRGNHYPLLKSEVLPVVRGRLRARYADLDTGEIRELVLAAGDQVRVAPRCAHSYSALEDSAAIEWATHDFDPEDAVAYTLD